MIVAEIVGGPWDGNRMALADGTSEVTLPIAMSNKQTIHLRLDVCRHDGHYVIPWKEPT